MNNHELGRGVLRTSQTAEEATWKKKSVKLIKAAMEAAPERKFVESVDISFTIKDVDLKNPNNRIKEEIRLPSGRGRELKVAMFAAGEAATKAKAAGMAWSFHLRTSKTSVERKVVPRRSPTNTTFSSPKSRTWD